MKEQIFIQSEFQKKTGISEAQLKEWESLKLIVPAGFTDDKIPFFTSKHIAEVEQILKLSELGYAIEEIEKIIKKVGLPQTQSGKRSKIKSDKYLTVGALSEKAGISPRTIKHWEDKGIIVPDMRSDGGFRLYSDVYILMCNLIQDLQRFGYSLENIKTISDYFRDFLDLQNNLEGTAPDIVENKLNVMLDEIKAFFVKTDLLKQGIQRWEDLLKKKKKEIQNLKNQNKKRMDQSKGNNNAENDIH